MTQKLSLKAFGLLSYLKDLKSKNINFFSIADATNIFETGITSVKSALQELEKKNYVNISQSKNLLGQWQSNQFEILNDVFTQDDNLPSISDFLQMRDKVIVAIANKKYNSDAEYSLQWLIKISTKEKFEKILMRSEVKFGFILQEIFKHSKIVFNFQKDCGGYAIDFYNEKYKLAVEYDEKHHTYQEEQDAIRQEYIMGKLSCNFIRVREGEELRGISEIISFFLYKINSKTN